ncbi:hypothetical protein H8959_010703 [Pygathrix nigripes]
MWLMLQNDEPEDFVIATGEVHSVREFVEKSFMHIGKTIVWEGKNENEVGRCKETGKVHVTVDLKYYRPTEVEDLAMPYYSHRSLAPPLRPLGHDASGSHYAHRVKTSRYLEVLADNINNNAYAKGIWCFCLKRVRLPAGGFASSESPKECSVVSHHLSFTHSEAMLVEQNVT